MWRQNYEIYLFYAIKMPFKEHFFNKTIIFFMILFVF